jgi:hypothetical protein
MSLALAGCWPVPGQNADRTSYNAFEQGITADNVGALRELWRWDSPDPTVRGPVTSSAGVHVVIPCGVITLDGRTGAVRWGEPIPADPSVCASDVAAEHASDPYVTPDGDRVIGSLGLTSVRSPGSLVAEWDTRVFDAATGATDGAAPVGFIEAERDRLLAGLIQEPAYPALAGTTLTLGDLDGARRRSFTTAVYPAVASGWPDAAVTLGNGVVFHSGFGILASTSGSGTQGQAVRAFSATESRPGCGPVSVPPVPETFSVECPLWVTPTDGTPTTPVLSPDGSTVYVRTDTGTVYTLDAATGAVRWTDDGVGAAGGLALAFGQLFVPTADGAILVYGADGCGGPPTCGPTGELRTGTTALVSTPAIAGQVLYATAGGSAFAFDARDISGIPGPGPLWSARGSGDPVVSSGRLYVHSVTGLIAYGLP